MSKPSVDALEQRAQSALRTSPIYDLHDLHVARNGDRLLISGTVTSFYHKQLAQEVVRAVVEGIEVVNSVDVSHTLD